MASKNYQDIAIAAQKRRFDSIPREFLLSEHVLGELPQSLTDITRKCGAFDAKTLDIVESGAAKILRNVHERQWTAVEVMRAFCRVAALAQQLTNCLTELLFDEALERAQYLDQELAVKGHPVGPLHGLPISLKDCFQTPPHPSSIGMALYAEEETKEESVLTSMLRELGAIPFVKTNVPVAMMMMETTNNVFGETINPHHRFLSAGGSSGGEAALISMFGSPLGVGTDIGGSIRIPSAFCGLYGLRPSFGRFPTHGTRSGIPGQEFVLSVNGPMARSLEDLIIYSRALLSASPQASPWNKDPKCVPLAWRDEEQILPFGRKLRLGLVGPHDGNVTAHPPVERALNIVRESLEAAGHEVIHWPLEDHQAMLDLLKEAFLGFGGPSIMPILDECNEPIFESMSRYADCRFTQLDANEIRKMCITRNTISKSFLDRWQATADLELSKEPIDGLIMAVSPWTAVRAGFTNSQPYGRAYAGYTGWVNILDRPSVTFPVTKANSAIDVKRSSFAALSELDGVINDDYDPDFYSGSIVSLQLVGERLREEKLLAILHTIEIALNKQDK